MNSPHHRPLSLAHLRSFDAVARHLSFSQAGAELFLTQPAISRHIRALEDELGALLFVRGTRHVDLSEAGQQLRAAVQPLLARLDETVRGIRTNPLRARIRVSTYPSFATLWLMPRLESFEREHPGVDIRISATDRLVELDEPDLDVLLRSCRPAQAPPGAEFMFSSVNTPVIGARLADAIARGEAPPLDRPADLAAHTLVEMEDQNPTAGSTFAWRTWLEAEGLPRLEPRRWISVNYTHQQVQFALAGRGVALVLHSLVHDALERGELVEPFGPALRRPTAFAAHLVVLPGARLAERPELQTFAQWVRERAAETRAADTRPGAAAPASGHAPAPATDSA